MCKSNWKKNELEKEVKKLQEAKESAESARDTYRRAFEDEMSKHKKDIFRLSLFRSRNQEDWKVLVKKNQQLLMLANELADCVVEREDNIKHLKDVNHLLGTRVKQIEEENNLFRQKLRMPLLEPQGSVYLKNNNNHSKKELCPNSPSNGNFVVNGGTSNGITS